MRDWQLLQADPLARLAVGTLAVHMVTLSLLCKFFAQMFTYNRIGKKKII
jgi:hypothetical protein